MVSRAVETIEIERYLHKTGIEPLIKLSTVASSMFPDIPSPEIEDFWS